MNKVVATTALLLLALVPSCHSAQWSVCPGYTDAKLKITNVSFNPTAIAVKKKISVTVEGTAIQSDSQKAVEIEIGQSDLLLDSREGGGPYSIDPKNSYKYTFDFTLQNGDYPAGSYDILFSIKNSNDEKVTCFKSNFKI